MLTDLVKETNMSKPNGITIVTTKDGSHSLYVPSLDEHYHSHNGSIQEALHVFIEAGLKQIQDSSIKILEVGFGTGLNAILSLIYSAESNIKLRYTGIETNPVSIDVIKKLNYLTLIGETNFEGDFLKLHEAKWGEEIIIRDKFSIIKHQKKVQEISLAKESHDIIFYDAFGPRAQKEMWDITIFQKLYNTLSPNGILVTYCAMGQLKRDLKSVGFKVESLPGPPGKREMTRAIKL